MIKGAARIAIATLVCSAVACGDHRSPPPAQSAVLGGELVARVGDDRIPVSLVVAVARAQKISKEEALERLVADAIAASAARKKGLDREPPTSWRISAAKARFTADRLLAEARSKGPATDEEIAVLTNQHWLEVDRPPSVRTVHAVVMVARNAPPERRKMARDVAEAIREAVVTATSAEDFIAKAKAIPHASELKVVAEKLPATSVEGWVTEGDGTQAMDPDFAKAANAITNPGDTSPVVDSSFGFHVIRLLDRVPEQRMPLEARRIAFVEPTFTMRARLSRDARLADWKAKNPSTIEPAAEALMRIVTSESAPQAPAP